MNRCDRRFCGRLLWQSFKTVLKEYSNPCQQLWSKLNRIETAWATGNMWEEPIRWKSNRNSTVKWRTPPETATIQQWFGLPLINHVYNTRNIIHDPCHWFYISTMLHMFMHVPFEGPCAATHIHANKYNDTIHDHHNDIYIYIYMYIHYVYTRIALWRALRSVT